MNWQSYYEAPDWKEQEQGYPENRNYDNIEKSRCGLCKQDVPFSEWGSHVKTQDHKKKEHGFFTSQDSVEFVACELPLPRS